MKLDIERDKILCHDVPLRLNGSMTTISGSRHVRDTDDWTIPASYSCLMQLMNEIKGRTDVDVTPAMSEWAQEATEFETLIHSYHSAADAPGNIKLLPLQRVASEYIRKARRGVLAYDMGGGKTVIACEAVASIPGEVRTTLVVCPKGVMSTWFDHFHEWSQDVTPIMATDSAKGRKDAIKKATDLAKKGRRVALIINYESAWRHTRLAPYGNLRMERCKQCDPTGALPVTKAKCETCPKELNEVRWDCVIADEAHRVINVSKQTRGLWFLTKEAQYVWALTGTPSRGSIVDFWSLLHLVDPVSWPSKTRFTERYCNTITDAWGQERVVSLRSGFEDEFEQVTQRYMIRRTFDQIMKSYADAEGVEYIPFELIPEKRTVEMTKDQRALYNQLADELFVTLPDGKIIWADNGLSKLTRLLQCASSMLEVEHVETEPDSDEDGVIVHMVKPSSKVNAVMEEFGNLPVGEPVIIFTVNRELAILTYEELSKAGILCSLVHGGIEREQRDEEILRFQEGVSQVIILTYATGAEGVTLTRSRIQFRMQLSWSMILNEQSVGRNRRYGQTEKVLTYVDFITADSVESRVHEAYGDKLEALETIVQDAPRMKELIYGSK